MAPCCSVPRNTCCQIVWKWEENQGGADASSVDLSIVYPHTSALDHWAVIGDEARTERAVSWWRSSNMFQDPRAVFVESHSTLCPWYNVVMEFICKLIQILCFSATLEIRCTYSQSDLIISHKATEWHLETWHIHVPYTVQKPGKGDGSFVAGLQKQVFVHPTPKQPAVLHSSWYSRLYTRRKLEPTLVLSLSLMEYETYAYCSFLFLSL